MSLQEMICNRELSISVYFICLYILKWNLWWYSILKDDENELVDVMNIGKTNGSIPKYLIQESS